MRYALFVLLAACSDPFTEDRDASSDSGAPDDAADDGGDWVPWQWTAVTVDASGRGDPSVAVGTDGAAQVTYYASPGDLRWATNASGAFQPEVVDAVPDTGGWSSIAIADDGVRISFHDYDGGRLVMARGGPGDWTTTTLDTGPRGNGRYTSQVIDGDGASHVGFARGARESSDLAYATDAGGAWAVETVDADGLSGEQASLATGPDGTLHLVHIRRDLGGGTVRHASRGPGGGAWAIETVSLSDGAMDVAVAVGEDGVVHLAWSGVDDGALHHAFQDGGAWTDEVVDGSGIVRGVAVAIATDGALHVAFHRAERCEPGPCDRGDLVHATGALGGWRLEVVDAEGATGFTPAIAVGPDGSLHVAYVDQDAPSVRHARGVRP